MATTEPGEAGLCSLAEALKTNETLEELHLEDVEISDEARAKLTEMLAANHKVTITGMTNAQLGNEFSMLKYACISHNHVASLQMHIHNSLASSNTL